MLTEVLLLQVCVYTVLRYYSKLQVVKGHHEYVSIIIMYLLLRNVVKRKQYLFSYSASFYSLFLYRVGSNIITMILKRKFNLNNVYNFLIFAAQVFVSKF